MSWSWIKFKTNIVFPTTTEDKNLSPRPPPLIVLLWTFIHKAYICTVTCLIATAWKKYSTHTLDGRRFKTVHRIKILIRCAYFSGKLYQIHTLFVYLFWPIITPYTVLVSAILLLINKPCCTHPACGFIVFRSTRSYIVFGRKFLSCWCMKIHST